mmetsp:Transcript_30594/g.91458  ORF Transcript_30594/g.91458 Transcript_30594/m.91458 type:complete len:246 (+) Transcript_30594:961-1698(+)
MATSSRNDPNGRVAVFPSSSFRSSMMGWAANRAFSESFGLDPPPNSRAMPVAPWYRAVDLMDRCIRGRSLGRTSDRVLMGMGYGMPWPMVSRPGGRMTGSPVMSSTRYMYTYLPAKRPWMCAQKRPTAPTSLLRMALRTRGPTSPKAFDHRTPSFRATSQSAPPSGRGFFSTTNDVGTCTSTGSKAPRRRTFLALLSSHDSSRLSGSATTWKRFLSASSMATNSCVARKAARESGSSANPSTNSC